MIKFFINLLIVFFTLAIFTFEVKFEDTGIN